MIKEEYIKELVEKHLEGTDQFPVSVKVKPGNKIMVYIDADSSIAISNCIQLSRYIESMLDRDKEDFELEVSSAGLDFPLTLKRQYIKNKGREVQLLLKNGMKETGILTEITDNGVEITKTSIEKINKKKEILKKTFSFTFDEIKETKIVVNI